jgi:DNA-binding NtrC family response regulator
MRTHRCLVSSRELVAKLNLLGESPAFRRLLEQIDRFAHCDATILIDGETGTGKELAARAIHYLSARRDGPFIPINCGSIPDSLVGSEFFGHSRGAFTDAREARAGLIAQADAGTLFLDEVEALSPQGQVALLRFLQDREYRPLGAAGTRTANVRVIGATNAHLSELCRRGSFRRDLLYRLNVLTIAVPPLRSRGDDAVVLARAFLETLSARYGGEPRGLHPDGIEALRRHDWPGNIRELENLLHREYLLSDEAELRLAGLSGATGTSSLDAAGSHVQDEARCARNEATERANQAPCLPQSVRPAVHASQPLLTQVGFREAKARAIAEFERAYVAELLTRSGGNISLAARLAGKERSRLGRLVRKYRLSARPPEAFPGSSQTN